MKLGLTLIFFFSYIVLGFSNPIKDSLTKVEITSDSVKQKINNHIALAIENSADKPSEAIKNYKIALIINTAKSALWEADVRTELAKLLWRSKSKDAILQFQKADILYKKGKSLTGRASAIEGIAIIYEHSGLFPEAIKAYTDLNKLQTLLGEAVLAGNALSHMADMYLKKQNYAVAFKYADLAQASYYSVCRKDSLGSVYYKMAQIKRKMNSPNVASFYIINKALPFFSATDNRVGRMKSFDVLGHIYKEQKRFSEAKWFYIQANTLSRELNDTAATINSLINMSLVKLAIGDKTLAKRDFAEADFLAQGNYAYLMKGVKLKYASMFKPAAKATLLQTEKLNESKKEVSSPIIFAEYVPVANDVADKPKTPKK